MASTSRRTDPSSRRVKVSNSSSRMFSDSSVDVSWSESSQDLDGVWDAELLLPAERKRNPEVLIGLSKEVIPSPMRDEEADGFLDEGGDNSDAGNLGTMLKCLNSRARASKESESSTFIESWLYELG